MNFVALCTTMSVPIDRGRCPSGVANVLSTTTSGAGDRRAAASAMAPTSMTSRLGLVGDSSHSRAQREAASVQAAVSVGAIVSTRTRPVCLACANNARVPA